MSCGLCVLFLTLVGRVACAETEEAVLVYREVQSSVVSLENSEGLGTGIIIDPRGLILTNAHVIMSPLPFVCKADVNRSGSTQTVEFRNVTVLGVHPVRDLALVQIDPAEQKGKLEAVRFGRDKVQPGQRVYAVGNPSGGDGIVLSKTITSGILSGVDRVVNGASYYQISAPINPGNSGGPLCDKRGSVIGLVTLKLSDAENVGFAIPLYNISLREFVPVSGRKSDPARSAAIADAANKVFSQFRKTADARSPSDPTAKALAYYALSFYKLALFLDPQNASLCYNVGMLLRTLGGYEAASVYLLRAIELDPWNKDGAKFFHELGLSLLKQGKKDEARDSWLEGIEKYPGRAVQLWQDLAVFWTEDQPDPMEAAYAASVVNELTPGSDVKEWTELARRNRDKLSETKVNELAGRTARIRDELKEKSDAAENAKKSGRQHITEAFAGYVTAHGTLKKDDESEKLAKAIRSGAIGSDALATGDEGTDLLAALDAHALRSDWAREESVLVSPAEGLATQPLEHATLPREYDLTLVVERRSGNNALAIGFVRKDVQSCVFIDALRNSANVLLDPDGNEARQGMLLHPDTPATIVCKIRDEGAVIMVNGQRVCTLMRTAPFPVCTSRWRAGNGVFVGSFASSFAIRKISVTRFDR